MLPHGVWKLGSTRIASSMQLNWKAQYYDVGVPCIAKHMTSIAHPALVIAAILSAAVTANASSANEAVA